MSRFHCSVCGYVHDSEAAGREGPFENLSATWRCPSCGAAKAVFTDMDATEKTASGGDPAYICLKGGFRYDPATGDPDHGAPPGTPFEDLPEDWRCPRCKAPKSRFAKEG